MNGLMTVRRELSLYRMVTRSIPRTEARSLEGCSRELRAVTLPVHRQLPRVQFAHRPWPVRGVLALGAYQGLPATSEDVLVASALLLQPVLIIPIS